MSFRSCNENTGGEADGFVILPYICSFTRCAMRLLTLRRRGRRANRDFEFIEFGTIMLE